MLMHYNYAKMTIRTLMAIIMTPTIDADDRPSMMTIVMLMIMLHSNNSYTMVMRMIKTIIMVIITPMLMM